MAPTCGIIVFPGSNCDHDAFHALAEVMHANTRFIWHKETDLSGIDFIIIPGGFSYGDYLRTGAIARFSSIMKPLDAFVQKGQPVLGICNGFQILLEAGLLPGVMLHNQQLRYVCKQVYLRCESSDTLFTRNMSRHQQLKVPVAHGEGNYFIDETGLQKLKEHDQIIFRYCNQDGDITKEANFNGSVDNIAAICNQQRNVLGMMPHPERAMEKQLGSDDGKMLFESILDQFARV